MKIKFPRDIDISYIPLLGNKDSLTLSKHAGSTRAFLNIYRSLTDGPEVIMSQNVVKRFISVLTVLQKVPFDFFEQAHQACTDQGLPIAFADVRKCYDYAQAQGEAQGEPAHWSGCQKMTSKEVANLRAKQCAF